LYPPHSYLDLVRPTLESYNANKNMSSSTSALSEILSTTLAVKQRCFGPWESRDQLNEPQTCTMTTIHGQKGYEYRAEKRKHTCLVREGTECRGHHFDDTTRDPIDADRGSTTESDTHRPGFTLQNQSKTSSLICKRDYGCDEFLEIFNSSPRTMITGHVLVIDVSIN